jgi:hypothetical protein
MNNFIQLFLNRILSGFTWTLTDFILIQKQFKTKDLSEIELESFLLILSSAKLSFFISQTLNASVI